MLTRMKFSMVAALLSVAVAVTRALPTGCSEDVHCPSGFYCHTARLFCGECLRCEEFHRDPPEVATCVTSVTQCNSCFLGFVEDKSGDQEAGCVPPGAQSEDPVPSSRWTMIAVGVLLLACLFAAIYVIAAYTLRNFDTVKIRVRSSARTLVRSPGGDGEALAALDRPPPYNALAFLPTPPTTAAGTESQAFIKHVPSPLPGQRESAGRQAARVCDYPAYIRSPEPLPPSYQPATIVEVPVHNRHTDVAMDNSANNKVVPEATADPPLAQDVKPPNASTAPAKLSRVTQDSNNNSESGDGDASAAPPFFVAHSGSHCIINVIKNINTMQ